LANLILFRAISLNAWDNLLGNAHYVFHVMQLQVGKELAIRVYILYKKYF